MASRIIDPQRFLLNAAITDWEKIARQTKRDVRVADLAKERRISTRVIQLRWLLDPGLGYPTEPFKVWRRPSQPMESEHAVSFGVLDVFPSIRIYTLDETLCFARARFQVNGSALVIAYAGAAFNSAVVDTLQMPNGVRDYTITGNAITSLLVYGDADLQLLSGLTGKDAADDKQKWELVEIVGLPVDPHMWGGVFNLDAKQGLVSALTDPRQAAKDRFNRGAALFGWDAAIASGKPAPVWKLANPEAIQKSYEQELDGHLRDMITTRPPEGHKDYGINQNMPVNGNGQNADARYKPMCMLMLGAGSDPLFSLMSGFGTAFDDIDIPKIDLGAVSLFGDSTRSDWDYMVTAHYGKGLDGQSVAVEYAAVIRAPKFASPPPKPANINAVTDGLTPPPVRDQKYKGVIRVGWDKLPDMTPFRVASFAFARTGVNPAASVKALMDDREFDPGVPHPISATTSPENELATGQLYALDESYGIDPTKTPNRLHYGIAQQDLYGLWSGWSAVQHDVQEPPVQSARILSARLDVVAAVSAICPATLVVDFAWDWTVRSPKTVTLAGKLYAASKPGAYPADMSIPAGFSTSFPGAAGGPVTISLLPNGTATSSLGTISYITDDSKDVQNTPVNVNGPRRYRLTIPGLSLSYASNGHVGIVLWARGQEQIAPQRIGDWSPEPKAATASDPRPPVFVKTHEFVELASLPDGKGEHRVKLDWDSVAGADGYFIYETTESKFRTAFNMGDAPAGETLEERLTALRMKFQTNPERRAFTRVNAQPLKALDAEVIIPRGSKEIHMYLVLGISAGQVESQWPEPAAPANPPAISYTTGKKFRAFAAPQIARPTPPTLEVRRDASALPVYKAGLTIRTRPGAVVTRIELFRTRVPEASLNVDTMGLPVATMTHSDGVWTVKPTVSAEPGENQPIGVISGTDTVEGSWKRVFYRAVAWSGDQPAKALYGGRSAASPAVEVIVPPAAAPDLSVITATPPSGTGVEFTVTSTAPVEDTALGPHRLRVEVFNVKPDDSLASLYIWPDIPPDGPIADRLADVPTVSGTGLWRNGSTLHVKVNKQAAGDRARIRILLTDPLGRSTERVLTSAAPPVLVPPDIEDVVLTAVAGKGYVLGFKTHAPLTSAYKLNVSFAPVKTGPSLPQPPLTASMLLSDIPLLNKLVDPFAGPEKIPLRHGSAIHGETPIGVYLRAKGQLTLELTGPKNLKATLTKKVQ